MARTIIFFLFISVQCSAQEFDSICPDCIEFPEVEAKFPSGPNALQLWIESELIYPEAAINYNDQGMVFMTFIIEIDGSITNVEVYRRVSKELDQEALRIMSNMPNFIPAMHNGKKVRSRARLPIVFMLE